MGALYHLIDS